MVLKPEREGVPPNVKLDGAYKFVDALRTLVPGAAPSLIGCSSLVVRGKVIIEAGVCFGGDVEVVNAGANSATLPAGTYINRVVRLPDGVAPALDRLSASISRAAAVVSMGLLAAALLTRRR